MYYSYNTMDLKIITWNVRGLQNAIKRKDIFQKLHKYDANIILLQETHSNAQTNHLWKNQWGNKAFFANGTSNARGVATLIDNRLDMTIKDTIADFSGRYLIHQIQMNDQLIAITNLYAPNEDNPAFFEQIFKIVESLKCDQHIFAGDYNFVLNSEHDHWGSTVRNNNDNAKEIVCTYMDKFNLQDIWRIQNPTKHQFTWARVKLKPTMSRLDYFLISDGLASHCNNCKITHGYRSDHSVVQLKLNFQKMPKGPGVWKFNNTLLNNKFFVEKVTELIERGDRRYAYCTAVQKWELIKQDILEFCRQFAKNEAKRKRTREFDLNILISELQQNLVNASSEEEIDATLRATDSLEAELTVIREQKAKAAAFRSKAKWTREGEQNTSYFFSLERRNYLNKTMHQVRLPDGSISNNYKDILKEQCTFYQNLYTKDEKVDFNIQNTFGVHLSQPEKDKLDSDINLSEVKIAIADMKKEKTPGIDGLTAEFYQTFEMLLAPILLEVFLQCKKDGRLGMSLRRGILTLIPKKDKDPLEISNLRPLTMLNLDYKIFARIIAMRLEGVINFLVGDQQTGFIKGRCVEENIRKTLEVVAYTKKNHKNAVIMMVDYSKCFDRVAHISIEKVMKFFNFGANFIQYLMLLYKDFELCTQNNGFTSNYINKSRGINQGCNASPLVYTLCGEVMALLIKHNNNINGLMVNEVLTILSQFADDTVMYLNYDPLTIETVTGILNQVENNLGLKVSYDKTRIYRVGSLAGSQAKLYTSKNYMWSNEPMDTLGVKIDCTDNSNVLTENYNSIIGKMNKILKDWYNRSLTLLGKIQVVNTLIGSLFVYKMNVMLNLSRSQISDIEKLIRDFLWRGKTDKIPLKILQMDKSQGGQRLVSLYHRQLAFKVKWIFKLQNSDFLRACAHRELHPHLEDKIWRCNLSVDDVRSLYSVQESFWAQVLEAWAIIHHWGPNTAGEVLQQIIWLNSHIKIGGKPVWWSRPYMNGVVTIGDLWSDGAYLTYEEVIQKYGNICTWLDYYALINAIPRRWQELLQKNPPDWSGHPELYEALRGTENVTKEVYDILIDDDSSILKYKDKWRNYSIFVEDEEYKAAFASILSCTKITKYRYFQYRLLLHKIYTNDTLHKWNKISNPLCCLCKTQRETPVHALYECEVILDVWTKIYEDLIQLDILLNELTAKNVMFNQLHESPEHIVNFICLYVKQYMYRCRCQGTTPSYNEVIRLIEFQQQIEYYNAKLDVRVVKHCIRWKPVFPDINEYYAIDA